MLFIFVVGPGISGAPYVRPLVRFIDERDIDASALFYTEIEEFNEADVRMRNAVKYAPAIHEGRP
jgi:hypothetical protein